MFLSLSIFPFFQHAHFFGIFQKFGSKDEFIQPWFLLKMISLLVPSHSLLPLYM